MMQRTELEAAMAQSGEENMKNVDHLQGNILSDIVHEKEEELTMDNFRPTSGNLRRISNFLFRDYWPNRVGTEVSECMRESIFYRSIPGAILSTSMVRHLPISRWTGRSTAAVYLVAGSLGWYGGKMSYLPTCRHKATEKARAKAMLGFSKVKKDHGAVVLADDVSVTGRRKFVPLLPPRAVKP
ncbi:hypothetical protein HDE_10092 [Halotydeus destructor]|nr:hypothetical protein HDE_10092 [Halotydeus destructor]